MVRYLSASVCLGIFSLFVVAAPAARAQEKIDFDKQIKPIFEAKCSKCHGAEKAQGKLRLHTAEAIGAFEKKDSLLVAAKPDESELFKRISLPADDKKRMPKGGDPLPAEEIALIKKWIEEGAVLTPTAAVVPAPAPAPAPTPDEAAAKAAAEAKAAEEAAAKAADEAALAEVTAAPPEVIAKLTAAGASVMPLYGESPLLQVSFARAEKPADDAALALLPEAGLQIIWLDLSGAQATAAGWAALAQLKNVDRLHLEKSTIDDASLAHVAGLPRLEYVNLYGTGVTDAGLEHLKALKRLRKLFLWQSKVSYDPAMALQAATPGLEVNLGWDHPGVVKVRLTKEMETAKTAAEAATAKAAEAQKALEAATAEKAAADARLQEIDVQLKALEPPAAAPAPAAAPPADPAAAPAPAPAPAAEAAPAPAPAAEASAPAPAAETPAEVPKAN